MVSEWTDTVWGKLASLEYGKGLRGYQEATGGPYPVYGTNGHIGWNSEALYPKPGVIIGRKVAYRGVHYSASPFFVIDTAFYLNPKTEFDPKWAYYQLLTVDINSLDSGSAIPSTSREDFYAMPVRVPPLAEQREIAHILGTLDDKIDLNRRMNATLEAIARAIFKSWFVDFDPVHAKARGEQPYGMDAETAALFPDAFEDSELGPIPAGWGVKRFGEISEKPQYGYTASAQDESVGPKFLRIKDINKTPWVEWATVPYCDLTESDYEKYKLRVGDIVIARMADPGHSALIEDETDAVFASYLIRFRSIDATFERYLQFWLRSDDYWFQVEGTKTGTTRSSLNAQVLSSFRLLLPPEEIATAFSHSVAPLRQMLVQNNVESQTLTALRDALLPKLISGEMRVLETTSRLDDRL